MVVPPNSSNNARPISRRLSSELAPTRGFKEPSLSIKKVSLNVPKLTLFGAIVKSTLQDVAEAVEYAAFVSKIAASARSFFQKSESQVCFRLSNSLTSE